MSTCEYTISSHPNFLEEVTQDQESMKKCLQETFEPIHEFFQPVGKAFTEYPVLKIPVAFVIVCAVGLYVGEGALLKGLYTAGCVAGGLASNYVITHIGTALELKASTISLIHSISFALRITITLTVGVALEIFKSISFWLVFGPSVSFISALKNSYDLRCKEMEAEAELTTKQTKL